MDTPLLVAVYSRNHYVLFELRRKLYGTITWTIPQSGQHAIEEQPDELTVLGYVEQLPEEGPKLVDVGCLPADSVLNEPEGVLQFFWWHSHCHLNGIEPETQPGHGLSWMGGIVICLLEA